MLILIAIFFILIILFGGDRGVKSFLTLCFNVIILSIMLTFISWRISPLLLAFLASLFISMITLFFQNGKNTKTLASFASMILVVLALLFITLLISFQAKLGGFNELMQIELKSYGISANLNLDFFQISIAMIITGLMGATIDTSVAISSAVYEVYRNNPELKEIQLFHSGIQIGKDILGTTINTLFFAFIGSSMSLFILFQKYQYSFLKTLNSKAFLEETIYIIMSGIGCVLIIPITAKIISYIITHPEKFKKYLHEDELFHK
jgi:uncharacterized membrane protein